MMWNILPVTFVVLGIAGFMYGCVMIVHAKRFPQSPNGRTYKVHGDLLRWTVGGGIVIALLGIAFARLYALAYLH